MWGGDISVLTRFVEKYCADSVEIVELSCDRLPPRIRRRLLEGQRNFASRQNYTLGSILQNGAVVGVAAEEKDSSSRHHMNPIPIQQNPVLLLLHLDPSVPSSILFDTDPTALENVTMEWFGTNIDDGEEQKHKNPSPSSEEPAHFGSISDFVSKARARMQHNREMKRKMASGENPDGAGQVVTENQPSTPHRTVCQPFDRQDLMLMLMQEMPGLFLNQNGDDGSSSSAMLRGAPPALAQTLRFNAPTAMVQVCVPELVALASTADPSFIITSPQQRQHEQQHANAFLGKIQSALAMQSLFPSWQSTERFLDHQKRNAANNDGTNNRSRHGISVFDATEAPHNNDDALHKSKVIRLPSPPTATRQNTMAATNAHERLLKTYPSRFTARFCLTGETVWDKALDSNFGAIAQSDCFVAKVTATLQNNQSASVERGLDNACSDEMGLVDDAVAPSESGHHPKQPFHSSCSPPHQVAATAVRYRCVALLNADVPPISLTEDAFNEMASATTGRRVTSTIRTAERDATHRSSSHSQSSMNDCSSQPNAVRASPYLSALPTPSETLSNTLSNTAHRFAPPPPLMPPPPRQAQTETSISTPTHHASAPRLEVPFLMVSRCCDGKLMPTRIPKSVVARLAKALAEDSLSISDGQIQNCAKDNKAADIAWLHQLVTRGSIPSDFFTSIRATGTTSSAVRESSVGGGAQQHYDPFLSGSCPSQSFSNSLTQTQFHHTNHLFSSSISHGNSTKSTMADGKPPQSHAPPLSVASLVKFAVPFIAPLIDVRNLETLARERNPLFSPHRQPRVHSSIREGEVGLQINFSIGNEGVVVAPPRAQMSSALDISQRKIGISVPLLRHFDVQSRSDASTSTQQRSPSHWMREAFDDSLQFALRLQHRQQQQHFNSGRSELKNILVIIDECPLNDVRLSSPALINSQDGADRQQDATHHDQQSKADALLAAAILGAITRAASKAVETLVSANLDVCILSQQRRSLLLQAGGGEGLVLNGARGNAFPQSRGASTISAAGVSSSSASQSVVSRPTRPIPQPLQLFGPYIASSLAKIIHGSADPKFKAEAFALLSNIPTVRGDSHAAADANGRHHRRGHSPHGRTSSHHRHASHLSNTNSNNTTTTTQASLRGSQKTYKLQSASAPTSTKTGGAATPTPSRDDNGLSSASALSSAAMVGAAFDQSLTATNTTLQQPSLVSSQQLGQCVSALTLFTPRETQLSFTFNSSQQIETQTNTTPTPISETSEQSRRRRRVAESPSPYLNTAPNAAAAAAIIPCSSMKPSDANPSTLNNDKVEGRTHAKTTLNIAHHQPDQRPQFARQTTSFLPVAQCMDTNNMTQRIFLQEAKTERARERDPPLFSPPPSQAETETALLALFVSASKSVGKGDKHNKK